MNTFPSNSKACITTKELTQVRSYFFQGSTKVRMLRKRNRNFRQPWFLPCNNKSLLCSDLAFSIQFCDVGRLWRAPYSHYAHSHYSTLWFGLDNRLGNSYESELCISGETLWVVDELRRKRSPLSRWITMWNCCILETYTQCSRASDCSQTNSSCPRCLICPTLPIPQYDSLGQLLHPKTSGIWYDILRLLVFHTHFSPSPLKK